MDKRRLAAVGLGITAFGIILILIWIFVPVGYWLLAVGAIFLIFGIITVIASLFAQ